MRNAYAALGQRVSTLAAGLIQMRKDFIPCDHMPSVRRIGRCRKQAPSAHGCRGSFFSHRVELFRARLYKVRESVGEEKHAM